MNQFTTKYASQIKGVLSGFDRLVFRGHLKRLCFVEGLSAYLSDQSVLLKDFKSHVRQVSQQVIEASVAPVRAEGRTMRYLASSAWSKEDIARQIATEQGITQGTVCVLSAVEPCASFVVVGKRATQQLELVHATRKCLHLYHYLVHPVFGFMNVRLQTWFPFSIQVCLNGREWLARQMDTAGIGYRRADNCFVWIEDYERAQALLDQQLQSHWTDLLGGLAQRVHPWHTQFVGAFCAGYYWSCYQSEWATDVTFADPAQLQRLYPRLVQQAMTGFGSQDVLRFLGKSVRARGGGEVASDSKRRVEGVRVKHRLNQNSVKMYDKAYTTESAVLRVETTLNDPSDFKVYRPKEGGSPDDLDWRELRRGVSDQYRRAQVSQKCNDRYLNALASLDTAQTLGEVVSPLTQPTTYRGKRVRALRPFETEDRRLLAAVNRGEFALNGLRNRDLQALYYDTKASSPEEARRRSGCIGRKLRLLRAHGIIQKVTGTHRYQVTATGRQILTALLVVQEMPLNQLLARAA